MKREIWIDAGPLKTRTALVLDGVLTEYTETERNRSEKTGDLYYGKIQKIERSLNAAFVDIGQQLNAFLPLVKDEKLKNGEWIVVQSDAKQAVSTKGLRVTRNILLAGRRIVLIPGEGSVSVSKKIKNTEKREALRETGESVRPDGFGMIMRTEAAGAEVRELTAEAEELAERWREACRRAEGMTVPGLLLDSGSPEVLTVREMTKREPARIVTNSREIYRALCAAQEKDGLSQENRIDYFDEASEKILLSDVCALDGMLEKAARRRVWLPCGGYLVIDRTEALTVIDVNSGKMNTGKAVEETAFKVNLEAVHEIARQIRLRGLGGIILADLIDMEGEEHREEILSRAGKETEEDPCKVRIEGFTKLGLLEMSRKRKEQELSAFLYAPCSICGGDGTAFSPSWMAGKILRQIGRKICSGQEGPFLIRCAPSVIEELRKAVLPAEWPEVCAVSSGNKIQEKYIVEQSGAAAEWPQDCLRLAKEMDS